MEAAQIDMISVMLMMIMNDITIYIDISQYIKSSVRELKLLNVFWFDFIKIWFDWSKFVLYFVAFSFDIRQFLTLLQTQL